MFDNFKFVWEGECIVGVAGIIGTFARITTTPLIFEINQYLALELGGSDIAT